MTPATSAISHGLKGQLFSLISMVSPLMQRINLPLFRDSAMTCNKGTVTDTWCAADKRQYDMKQQILLRQI